MEVEINEEILEALEQFKQPVSVAEAPLFLKAVIYGDGGVGKTVLSCRFGKTLLISTDSGWAVTKNQFPFELDVTKIDYQGIKHLAYTAKALRMRVSGYDDYDTVVVDTLSGATEEYLDTLLTNHSSPKRNTLSPRNVAQAAKEGITSIEVSGFDDYNAVKTVLRPPLRDLMAAPINVFLITHEKELDPFNMKKDGTSGKMQPDLPDKVYKLAMYNTHIVGRMTRDGNKREISLNTTSKVSAKSRIQILDGKKVTDEQFIEAITHWRNQ